MRSAQAGSRIAVPTIKSLHVKVGEFPLEKKHSAVRRQPAA